MLLSHGNTRHVLAETSPYPRTVRQQVAANARQHSLYFRGIARQSVQIGVIRVRREQRDQGGGTGDERANAAPQLAAPRATEENGQDAMRAHGPRCRGNQVCRQQVAAKQQQQEIADVDRAIELPSDPEAEPGELRRTALVEQALQGQYCQRHREAIAELCVSSLHQHRHGKRKHKRADRAAADAEAESPKNVVGTQEVGHVSEREPADVRAFRTQPDQTQQRVDTHRTKMVVAEGQRAGKRKEEARAPQAGIDPSQPAEHVLQDQAVETCVTEIAGNRAEEIRLRKCNAEQAEGKCQQHWPVPATGPSLVTRGRAHAQHSRIDIKRRGFIERRCT